MTPVLTPTDHRAIAEALADVLQERGLITAPANAVTAPARVLDVAQVAEQLGRSTDWVYNHAAELGAFRMGTGPRARLGFDQQHLDAWKRQQSLAPADTPPPRRRRGTTVSATPDLIPFDQE